MGESDRTECHTDSVGVLENIRHAFPGFSVTNKRIASYVLEHSDEVIELSVTALADICGVGEATIIRFCQGLGFKGFQDLKLSLARERAKSIAYIEREIKDSDDFATIVETVAYRYGMVFPSTISVLDMSTVERTVQLLRDSERRLLYGVGHSGVSAIVAKHQLLRVGVHCECHIDSHFASMIAASLGPRDLYLCFSHSGSTKDMVECTKIAKQTGASIVVITSYSKSPLARLADVILCTTGYDNPLFAGSLAVQLSQLFVVNVLLLGVMIELDVKGLEVSYKTVSAVVDKLY